MISPGHDIAGYVQAVIVKRETIVQACFRKKYDIEGKIIVQIRLLAWISLNIST